MTLVGKAVKAAAAAIRVSEKIEPAALAKYRVLELRRGALAGEYHEVTTKLAGIPWNWPDKDLSVTLNARVKAINAELVEIGTAQDKLMGRGVTFPQAPDFRAALVEQGWQGNFR